MKPKQTQNRLAGSNRTQRFDCTQAIMQRIETEEIVMKPKWVFYIGSISLIFGIASFTLLASFLLSYVWYHASTISYERLTIFGTQGWLIFMTRLPWAAVSASFLMTLIGWWLVQQSQVGYRHRKRVVILSVLSVILASSYMIHMAHVWEWVPTTMQPRLREITPPHQDAVLVGRIIRRRGALIQLEHRSGSLFWLELTKNTTYDDLRRPPIVGEYIAVMGQWQGDRFLVNRVHTWMKDFE